MSDARSPYECATQIVSKAARKIGVSTEDVHRKKKKKGKLKPINSRMRTSFLNYIHICLLISETFAHCHDFGCNQFEGNRHRQSHRAQRHLHRFSDEKAHKKVKQRQQSKSWIHGNFDDLYLLAEIVFCVCVHARSRCCHCKYEYEKIGMREMIIIIISYYYCKQRSFPFDIQHAPRASAFVHWQFFLFRGIRSRLAERKESTTHARSLLP